VNRRSRVAVIINLVNFNQEVMISKDYEVCMAYLVACLMAALSFLLNRMMVGYVGFRVAITYSAIIEELSKSLPAFILGADMLVTHATFGLIEAGYDWQTSKNHRVTAAAFSLLGHSFFGLVTIASLDATGSIVSALVAGILVHLVWNVTIMRIAA